MNLLKWISNHSTDIFIFLGQITLVAISLFIAYLILRTADLLPGFTFDPFTIIAIIGVGWYLGKKIDTLSSKQKTAPSKKQSKK